VLQRLVDAQYLIVIEHHLDVIKNAITLSLGPGAGDKGGYLIASGTPEEIIQQKNLRHRTIPAPDPGKHHTILQPF